LLFDLFINQRSEPCTTDDIVLQHLSTLSQNYANMRRDLNETAKMFRTA
jgi:hypothetical protein